MRLAFFSVLFGIAVAAECVAAETVDVELVLGVDTSQSMDFDELTLQREGYAAALEHPALLHAIGYGLHQKIAIIYFDWGGPGKRDVVLPWTIISSQEDAAKAAAALRASPVKNLRGTGISGAILSGIEFMEGNAIQSERQIIDISGDGPNNVGTPVTEARDKAAAKGIEVNGLPLILKEANSIYNLEDLDIYYQDCVITGEKAFVLPVRDVSLLSEAILRKLILEIAGIGRAPKLWKAASTDCLIGEKLRAQRWFDDP